MASRKPTKSIEKLIAERLQERRAELGLSQAELARRAGVSQSSLLRVEEGGRSCTVGTLAKLAKGLGIEPAELLAEIVDRPKPTKAEKVFYRVCNRLRDRDADQLRAVEDLIRALDRVTS